MKKILIFSTAYFPFVGGAEIAVKEITDRIDDIQFDMITARMDSKLPTIEQFGNIKIYRAGYGLGAVDKFLLPFFGLVKALKLQRINNYDVIWSVMASQASIAAAWFKKIKPKLKLVLTLQEGDEEEYLRRYVFGNKFLYKLLIRPWHVLVIKKADVITAISTYLKERAKKSGAKADIKIVPNGVGVAHFSQDVSEEDLQRLKTRLSIRQENNYLMTISRLVEKNAVDDIIRALTFLPKEVILLVVGDGLQREMLIQLAQELEVYPRIKLIGHIDHQDLPKYLKLADIFIRPSLSEGFGNVFVEAMAVGVPVIATPAGGIPDFLFDPDKNPDKKPTGLFCDIRDPKSIAKQVTRLLGDGQLRETLTTNAKDMVKSKYDWDIIARDMKQVLEG